MGRFVQSPGKAGSLRAIQHMVNIETKQLNNAIMKALSVQRINIGRIEWVSPLDSDGYAEYRDQYFLSQLKLNPPKRELSKFWPKGGPQWDGLATTDQAKYLLAEAKANIPEILSTPCGAKREESLSLIRESLKETRNYLAINDTVDWMNNFYQYTNRLAHLYYLRILNEIDAYLIFIYFYNDSTVNYSPQSVREWQSALYVMKAQLGLRKHKLSRYMIDIFVDLNTIAGS